MVIPVIVSARRGRLATCQQGKSRPCSSRTRSRCRPSSWPAFRLERLRELVDRLIALGGLQGTRLTEAGVAAGADVNLATLSRLPTTTKADLWDAYPFGLLAVPREDVVAVHGSSGTGGRPTLVAYTRG